MLSADAGRASAAAKARTTVGRMPGLFPEIDGQNPWRRFERPIVAHCEAPPLLLGSLVDLDLDAVRADRPGLGELQPEAVDAVGEEAPAAPEDRGEDHQPELIDEV